VLGGGIYIAIITAIQVNKQYKINFQIVIFYASTHYSLKNCYVVKRLGTDT